jgi:hypothetical protein
LENIGGLIAGSLVVLVEMVFGDAEMVSLSHDDSYAVDAVAVDCSVLWSAMIEFVQSWLIFVI